MAFTHHTRTCSVTFCSTDAFILYATHGLPRRCATPSHCSDDGVFPPGVSAATYRRIFIQYSQDGIIPAVTYSPRPYAWRYSFALPGTTLPASLFQRVQLPCYHIHPITWRAMAHHHNRRLLPANHFCLNRAWRDHQIPAFGPCRGQAGHAALPLPYHILPKRLPFCNSFATLPDLLPTIPRCCATTSVTTDCRTAGYDGSISCRYGFAYPHQVLHGRPPRFFYDAGRGYTILPCGGTAATHLRTYHYGRGLLSPQPGAILRFERRIHSSTYLTNARRSPERSVTWRTPYRSAVRQVFPHLTRERHLFGCWTFAS